MEDSWDKIRSSSKQGMEALYDALYKDLYAYAIFLGYSKDTAKEGIQQLFLEVWDKRSTLPAVQAVKPYLFTWLRRLLNAERKGNNIPLTPEIPSEHDHSHEEIMIRIETAVETSQKLDFALRHLTEKQRKVIHMRFFEQCSYAEIAAATSSQIRTVYNLVHESIKVMKKYLKNNR